MKKLFFFFAVALGLFLVGTSSTYAQQCDFTTTATQGWRARHNYTVHNNRGCTVNYTITRVTKNTNGDTQFEADNLRYSGTIPGNQTVELGNLSFITNRCQAGEADSSIEVTAEGFCGTDTDTYSLHTKFCTNCAQIPTLCADTNNDGVYDACTPNGTGPSCANVAECLQPPRHCNPVTQQCVPGGTGISCDNDAACRPQPQQCADTNSDGVYDACNVSGTGPSCANVNECLQPPNRRCNPITQQCVLGGTGNSCANDSQCQPQPTLCADTNSDGVFDACNVSGTGPSCTNVAECQQLRRCNPVTQQCVLAGTGASCTNDSQCQPQPTLCADTNSDGVFDACNVSGTGPSCTNVSECLLVRRCNPVTQQCVLAGTGASCSNDAQCQPQINRCADTDNNGIFDACNVSGSGPNCATVAECQVRRCNPVTQQCVLAGTGASCTSDAQCQPQTNRCADTNNDGTFDACNVSGSGPNCTTIAECQVRRCNPTTRQCVIAGTGASCTSDAQCIPTGGSTSCNTSCAVEGAPCSDNGAPSNNGNPSICISINGSLTCRNPSCASRTNCACGGGGSPRCNDTNNDGVYDSCDGSGQGPVCNSLNDCNRRTCTPQGQCVLGFLTGASCNSNSDCRGGGGGNPFCGDGILQAGEQCDDGNRIDDGNGCTADCRLVSPRPNRCHDADRNGVADSCIPNGNMDRSCATMADCIGPQMCTQCACVEKTVDPPLAGDNQAVRYRVVIGNQTQGVAPFMPFEVQVRDTIFQKKKYKDNDPLQGLLPGNEGTQSTEGYIEYPNEICIVSNPNNARVCEQNSPNCNRTSGCFAFRPGVNVGDPTVLPGGNAPFFRIYDLRPGNEVAFEYSGTARTSRAPNELGPTTQFIDITNEVRTQTNNDYASVVVSKPYLITRNSGNLLLGSDPEGVANVTNLVSAITGANLNTDFFKNIAGLILSPTSAIKNLTSYLSILTNYTSLNSETLSQQLDKNVQDIIRNVTHGAPVNRVTSEDGFESLGKRPDNARIYVSQGDLSVTGVGGAALEISKRETIVVNGNLKILSDIKYKTAAGVSSADVPSIAFVVLKGNIEIAPGVTRLDGVYIVKDADYRITSLDGTTSQQRLLVNGSLFGNIDELLKYRTFVGLPDQNGASVTVNYDARILSATPPGLKDILGGIIFQQIAK